MDVDRHLVFFEAYGGRSFACSPKALYLAMIEDERFADYRFVWSFKEGACPEGVPACVETSLCGGALTSVASRMSVVVRGSREYFAVLARAGFIVVNSRLPEYVTPKLSQVYVQCWHGTPLKRLGYDVAPEAGGALNTASELAQRFGMDSRKWTYLLSPSAFASEHLADAFGLARERRAAVVLEEGYPRNDYLVRAAEDQRLCTVARAQVGVPEGKKVVLYAPTWRDDSYASDVGYTFDCLLDLERLKELLEDEWVVLFRAHYYIANKFDFSELEGFVIDASGIDDVNVAYAAADALVTDYSSVVFDYGILRRPIIMHAPDRLHYEHAVRGFTFLCPKCQARCALQPTRLPSSFSILNHTRIATAKFTSGFLRGSLRLMTAVRRSA